MSPAAEHPDASPLRIAVLGLGRYSGGSPIGFHLTRALAARHVVRAFVGREALNLHDWQESGLDVDLHRTYQSAAGAVASLIVPHRIQRLAKAIRAFAPDVVLVPFVHLWVWPLLSRLRLPLVVVVHDPEPHPGLPGRIWHAIDRRIARGAQHVIVHSSAFVQTVIDRYGIEPSRISVVPIGPLVEYATGTTGVASARRAASSSDRPCVLFFGRMDRYKGIEVLLDAVPDILARFPHATVRLVGSGLDRTLAVRAAATPGVVLESRWVDDSEVTSIFAAADLVVLPYTSATQSGVIPLAAALGLPVVASDVGGLAEQLDHGACGVLVPSGDGQALARAVVDLLSDHARAQELGTALRETYATKRSWISIADAVADACRSAMRGTNGR